MLGYSFLRLIHDAIMSRRPALLWLLLVGILVRGYPLPASADQGEVHLYLPLVRNAKPCRPISDENYDTLSVKGPPTDRPAEEHADLNLALRGYVAVEEAGELVDYDGDVDSRAPQLAGLFADRRTPTFATTYRVHDWNWTHNRRGNPITQPPVTLAGLETDAKETVHAPDAGTRIGEDYVALVLYASERRLTLKYTREDNVIYGYTIHIEDIWVEPRLLALYRTCDDDGRGELPALRGGQALGRARGTEIGVAIRDCGSFMDPRSRKDWWQDF